MPQLFRDPNTQWEDQEIADNFDVILKEELKIE